MVSELDSVVTSKKLDGSWQALHVPSGKVSHGLTADEARQSMRDLLGMDEDGHFSEPSTSERFEGEARDIAIYLEGTVSEMLAAHSGFARLEGFAEGTAHIRLGGGCSGCPSSTLTLVQGVKSMLQERFGEDLITDVAPVYE